MKKARKEESYIETMIDYQDKRSLPGAYIGGNLHPAFKAKTKAGGYFMLLGGISLLGPYSLLLLIDFRLENLGWIIGIVFAILLVIVGIKFIRHDSHNGR
jgi:hypothetical protein